jgi:hypothetical protein
MGLGDATLIDVTLIDVTLIDKPLCVMNYMYADVTEKNYWDVNENPSLSRKWISRSNLAKMP